jgi:hypothetical protein
MRGNFTTFTVQWYCIVGTEENIKVDEKKKARLEAQGWKVGSTEEFLGLTPVEAACVELRLQLSDAARGLRRLTSRGSQRQPRRGDRN